MGQAVALGRRGGPAERKKASRSLLSPSLRANRGRRGVGVEADRNVEGGVEERRRRGGGAVTAWWRSGGGVDAWWRGRGGGVAAKREVVTRRG
jgi:hypothetical protein